jgi:hypothetical protein
VDLTASLMARMVGAFPSNVTGRVFQIFQSASTSGLREP